jgi:hypothetical protein
MNTVPRTTRALLLALIAALVALAGCGDTSVDDQTVRPAAVTTPSGQVCQPWVNNPHEAEIDGSTIRPCDYPIPTDRPVQRDGMSATDFALLMLLFNNGLGHSDYYFGPGYYGSHIGPAWNRYPGSYYGYGHSPVSRVDARTYNTVVIKNVTNTYAADIKRDKADPRFSTFKSASGKSYNGNTVPKTAFKGSNVPVTGAAGEASKSNTPKKATTPATPKNTSPGSGYVKPATPKSNTSTGHSSSGGSRSSGGGRR